MKHRVTWVLFALVWLVCLSLVGGGTAVPAGGGGSGADASIDLPSVETDTSTDLPSVETDTSTDLPSVETDTSADQTSVETDASTDTTAFGVDIDADSTQLRADLRADGDADWRVVYRLVLEDDDEIRAFEELQADVEDDPDAYLDPFEGRMRDLAESAERATGREMAIENVSIETERQRQPQADIGRITYSFEWSGFAAVENGDLRAGDAIDRLFLDENEDLTVTWPAEYHLASHRPTGELGEHRVTWRGRIEFEAGEPRVTLTTDGPDDGDDPTDTDDPGNDDESNDVDDTEDGLGSLPVAGFLGLAAILAAVAAALLFRRRERTTPDAVAQTDEHSDEGPPEETTGESDTSDPPAELLSPEERVLGLLEANGGRVKQKQVTEELGWSAARTSQVVGGLREEGKLDSFRLGRENVLTLPDVDIETGGPTRAREDANDGEPTADDRSRDD